MCKLNPFAAARYFAADYLQGEEYHKVIGAIRARDIPFLATCSELSGPSINPDLWVHLRQIEAFFKKNSEFVSDGQCAEAAERSFLRAERLCRIGNKRLDYYYFNRDRLDINLDVQLARMESYIEWVLGPIGPFLDSLPSRLRLTPGATEDRNRSRSLPFLKISGSVRAPKTSHGALQLFARHIVGKDLRLKEAFCNRVTFVPKNYKTHRTIACEPTGALPFQLAFDSYAKERLRRVGIDLSDQARNQELAREGSIHDSWATIDLSMASDTLAFNAVAWMLPREWFEFVNAFRSPGYRAPFGSGVYSKFSSMGNGTTFPIETLVFSAACHACGASEFSVYGDDIIIGKDHVPRLIKLLAFLGFRVNADKSFVDGPFRESCGADYLRGRLVTPFYWRKPVRTDRDFSLVWNNLAKIVLPGGKLEEYLKDCLKSRLMRKGRRLPIIPVIEDESAGVQVVPADAYSLGVIFPHGKPKGKLSPWQPKVLATVEKSVNRTNRGWRTLLHWHLRAYGREVVAEISRSRRIVSSTYRDYVPAGEICTTTMAQPNAVRIRNEYISYRPPARLLTNAQYYASSIVLSVIQELPRHFRQRAMRGG